MKLKNWVEQILIIILTIMFIITCMIDSITPSWKLLGISIIWFGIMYIIFITLKKYGRGLWEEK